MCVVGWVGEGRTQDPKCLEWERMGLQGPQGEWLPATTQAGPALAHNMAIDVSAGREEMCVSVY